MADDVLTRNGDGELAVRTVQSTGDNYVNPNDVYTRDNDGKLCVRTVGNGGGGDSHNKGYYATPEALRTAYPTAEAGDFAIVESTDTIWIWDTDNSEWVDSHKTDSVTSVNGKIGAVVLDAEDVGALPDDTPIPAPQVNSDWNATSGVAEILNKPTIPSTAQQVGAVPQYETMPTADASNVGEIAQYSGATAGSYTNGYFYQSIIALNVLSGTVEFNPASISGTTVTCSGADFANFVANWGSGNITDIIKGTLTYDQSGGLLVFVGQDDTDTQVCTFQLYTQDYEDAGFTFTGTLQDGDVFAFTCTITETPVYDWTRIDVQPQPVIPDPLPSQTNKEGMFLLTNGSTAQWSDTRLTHSTTKTFTYDENTVENVLRITPKQNRDCWVRVECWEGLDDGEGGLKKRQQLFTSDLYLSHADLLRQDGNFSSKALITNLSIGNYIFFEPCVQAFYDEGGQTVGGFFDIDTFYTYEEEIPTGEERYVIMDIKYSDGVDTFTYPETFEGAPLDYSTGMLLPNPTSIKSGYGNVNCIPMAEYGGQDVQWFRYPFGNVIVNYFDNNAKTLVTQDGDFTLTWASQVRELPTFDNADEYPVLLDPVAIFQYTGETTNDYTQGYFYKIQYDLDRNAVATQTAGSSLTDITVNQAVFADWIKQEWGYFQGTYEFTFDGSNWSGTYGGEYANLTDMGITYTGTPVADDVIEVTFDGATWTWVQVNTQPAPDPLPSQTGQSGKFLITDGTDAGWGNTIKPITITSISTSYTDVVTVKGYNSNKSILLMNMTPQTGQFEIDVRNNTGTRTGWYYFDSAFYPHQIMSNLTLGKSTNKWDNVYTTKINNGADIAVPTTGGTMVVAVPPTTPNTSWVLKATVDANGDSTVAWVQEV